MVLWEMLVPSQSGWLLEVGSHGVEWFPSVPFISLSSIFQLLEAAAGLTVGDLSSKSVAPFTWA